MLLPALVVHPHRVVRKVTYTELSLMSFSSGSCSSFIDFRLLQQRPHRVAIICFRLLLLIYTELSLSYLHRVELDPLCILIYQGYTFPALVAASYSDFRILYQRQHRVATSCFRLLLCIQLHRVEYTSIFLVLTLLCRLLQLLLLLHSYTEFNIICYSGSCSSSLHCRYTEFNISCYSGSCSSSLQCCYTEFNIICYSGSCSSSLHDCYTEYSIVNTQSVLSLPRSQMKYCFVLLEFYVLM